MPEGEFEFIANQLRPLAADAPAALGLADDAALLEPPPGMQLAMTKDMLVEGVHFLPHDPAAQIAQKLLRVNLSDLAAMGADPLGYLLALARPKRLPPEWLARFCSGLADDQQEFGLHLLGGDTVSTPGPLTLSITALGAIPRGQALRRDTARAGDDLYVSGTLGDAALGLQVLQGRLSPPMAASAILVERYQKPQPRLALGQALRGIAHAAIDISDGLIADLGHVLEASQLGAELWADAVPFSAAAARQRGAREAALTGGDDYELLFAVHPEQGPVVDAIGQQLGLPMTRIGHLHPEPGLHVLDRDGRPVTVERTGWQHF